MAAGSPPRLSEELDLFVRSVPDCRRSWKGNYRHKLYDMLLLTVAARISGCVARKDIVEYGNAHLEELRSAYGILDNGCPSEPTLYRMEKHIDNVEFERLYSEFATSLVDDDVPDCGKARRVVAIDGKYMRGTYIARINSQGHNKINWQKTISRITPTLQDDYPVYAQFLNKSKAMNFDEELLVLFYSVLDYLHDEYNFKNIRNVNYQTNPREVKRLIESGKGTRLLRSIRRKYFKDELVELWQLLNVFFQKAENVASKRTHEEALLVKDFNRVFEDMYQGDVYQGDVYQGDGEPDTF